MTYILIQVYHSNGRTPGIALPDALGQEAVVRKAYAAAQLELDETVYVEVSQQRLQTRHD
jgi:acyl transferase domain-containing protein